MQSSKSIIIRHAYRRKYPFFNVPILNITTFFQYSNKFCRKTDFFMKNGKPYINSQSSILNHSIETTLHPFNWLHLNIERLCNSEDKYLSIQWFQINIIEIKGFLFQFNYLSTSHGETKNNLTNTNHFFIHRLNVSMQQNHNLQNNIFQFNIKIKYQNNNLQYVDLNCLVFQKDSYHLQSKFTQFYLYKFTPPPPPPPTLFYICD